jgi:hypothetical protein
MSTVSLNKPKNYMQGNSDIIENLELKRPSKKFTASPSLTLVVKVARTFLKLTLIFSTGQYRIPVIMKS